MAIRAQLVGSLLLCVVGVELKSSGLSDKCFNRQSQLPNPVYFVFMRQDSPGCSETSSSCLTTLSPGCWGMYQHIQFFKGIFGTIFLDLKLCSVKETESHFRVYDSCPFSGNYTESHFKIYDSCPSSRNYTLRFMPIPMYDAAQALKTNPEKTEEALQKVWRPASAECIKSTFIFC